MELASGTIAACTVRRSPPDFVFSGAYQRRSSDRQVVTPGSWRIFAIVLKRHDRFSVQLEEKRNESKPVERFLIPPFPGSNPGAPAKFLLPFHCLDRSVLALAIFISKPIPRFISKFCSRSVR